MMLMSIRARLLWLAALIVVPTVCAAAWIIFSTYEREQRSFEQTLRETARALALVVDRELSKREAVLRTLATSPSLIKGDYAAFADQAVAATRGTGDWVLLNDREQLYLDTHLPDMLVMQPGSPPPVMAFLESGTTVSNLIPSQSAESDIITVQTAVASPKAHAGLYNLFVSFRTSELQQVLRDQALPKGWMAAVLDRNNVVVAYEPNPEKWVGKPAPADLIKLLNDRRDGLMASRSLDGEPTTTFFSKSPRYGWTFVIAVPNFTRNANIRQALAETSIGALVLVTFAIGVAVLVSRRISGPAMRLREAARNLDKRGHPPFQPTGVPEIDEVGSTLNSAGERISLATEELERKVAAAVEETRRAQERLASVERLEALGRLTGGVAHDVNNLLAVITNNLFVLERLLPETRNSAQVAAIRRAVDTGRTLTQKLLAFARQRAMRPEVISLQSWLTAMEPLLKTSLSAPTVLKVSVAPDTHPVEIDPTELELALVNLAVNANDAMRDGGTLSVTARNAAPGESGDNSREFVVIEVKDTGCGMQPSVVSRAFEPFFTTKEVSKGSGLGLSQVYGACVQAGGTARIESVEGKGTTVYMYLPATTRPISTPTEPQSRPEDAVGRVLYVEDNADLAMTTQMVLEALGYTVTWVSDAAAALSRLEEEEFDVMLSDVVMPGSLNGIELAACVRKLRPDFPVLLMTGYAAELDGATRAGFEVLQKPCPPETLAASLARALRKRKYATKRETSFLQAAETRSS